MPGLEEFAENFWIADCPLVRDMGLLFPTRMIVPKLATGDVWVNSPVAVPSETLGQITGKGPVRYPHRELDNSRAYPLGQNDSSKNQTPHTWPALGEPLCCSCRCRFARWIR